MRFTVATVAFLSALLTAAMICVGVVSNAQDMGLTGVGGYMKVGGAGGGYTGPGNVVSADMWGGLRAYTTAIANAGTQAAANFRRASDSHTCDIKVNSSGGLGNTSNCSTGGDNGTPVATWCNATTCSVAKLYDQSASQICQGPTPCDLVQATAANQPTVTFNCIGTKPCMVTTRANSSRMLAANVVSPNGAQPYSIGFVALNTSVVSNPVVFGNDSGSNPVITWAAESFTSNAAGEYAGVSGATSTAGCGGSTCINKWVALVAVYNSTTSKLNLNGTATTGLSAGTDSLNSNHLDMGGDGFGDYGEGSTTEVAAYLSDISGSAVSLCQNEQAYYGAGNFPVAC